MPIDKVHATLATLTATTAAIPTGGTTGQALVKSSNTNYDTEWATPSATVADGAVTTAKLADDAVTSAKIAADAVGTSEIAADAVTSSEIAADAVGSSEIAAGAVGTSELADGGVTAAKLDTNVAGELWRPVEINAWMAPTSSTTGSWALNVASGFLDGYVVQNTGSPAINDERTFSNVAIPTGTWTLKLAYSSLTSGGILTVKIDGSSVGTIDTYAAVGATNQTGTIAGISVTGGVHSVQIISTSKNASSSNYAQRYGTPRFYRTA